MIMAEKRSRYHVSDRFKAGLLRWWLAGMCYFLVGFGTQSGLFDSPLDLIFFLGVAVGLTTVYIYNPIAYSIFSLEYQGESLNLRHWRRKGWRKALYNLGVVAQSLALVALIYLTYQNINLFLVRAGDLPEDTVIVAGEPFGFATLYLIFHTAFSGLVRKVRKPRQEDQP